MGFRQAFKHVTSTHITLTSLHDAQNCEASNPAFLKLCDTEGVTPMIKAIDAIRNSGRNLAYIFL
jgi:hypothetical protein